MIHHTTLAELKKHSSLFLNELVLDYDCDLDFDENTPIPLVKILEICGMENALSALRCDLHPDAEKETRLFICDVAERVLPLFEKKFPLDERPRKAVETARAFAEDKATKEDLARAWDAANAASFDSHDSFSDGPANVAACACTYAADFADNYAAYADYATFYAYSAAPDEYGEKEAQKKLFRKHFGEKGDVCAKTITLYDVKEYLEQIQKSSNY